MNKLLSDFPSQTGPIFSCAQCGDMIIGLNKQRSATLYPSTLSSRNLGSTISFFPTTTRASRCNKHRRRLHRNECEWLSSAIVVPKKQPPKMDNIESGSPDAQDGQSQQSDTPAASPRPNAQPSAPAPYTVLSKYQKRYITYLLGYLCLVSSLSATIYFPLVPLLANIYATSMQAINLTITLYIVFQGIAPSFWSPLSDTLGRRPVFLATFGVYTAASLGLSLSGSNYAALALLRALQSIGGSAILSIAYGVVADVSTHAERGGMLGPMLASGNLGPCLGPVIGAGAIFATGQPIWCFRVLVILGGISFSLIGWTFPETNRRVVGNGTVSAVGVWKTWWSVFAAFMGKRATRKQDAEANEKDESVCPPSHSYSGTQTVAEGEATGRGKFTIPNPLASLYIIFSRSNFLTLFLAASPYSVWYLIQTSIPTIYGPHGGGYAFSDVAVGLCYLAGGSGVIAGGFIAGRLMDWNYKVVARRGGVPIDSRAGDNTEDFPFEDARSRGSILILGVSTCAVAGFGWAVQYRVHPSVPLILQCYIGAKCTVLHQMYSALLVDLFPDKPSTAAASNNIVRCALSAAAVAVLQPLVDSLGRAWFFTLVALLDGGLCMVAVLVLRQWGRHWRNQRDR
jgi:MFS family permease